VLEIEALAKVGLPMKMTPRKWAAKQPRMVESAATD
jgi:hypothetical protein